MIHLIRRSPYSLLPKIAASFSEGSAYVPLRPLKETRNVLFTLGGPISYSPLPHIINWGPLLAFVAEGFINGWSGLVVAGSVFTFFLAIQTGNVIVSFRAMQIRQLVVNKNLSKFELVVPGNPASLDWEDLLLKAKRKTFFQEFEEQLKNGSLVAPSDLIEEWKASSPEQLQKQSTVYRFKRSEIPLTLDRHQIRSFSLKNMREIKKTAVKRLMGRQGKEGKSGGVLEDYNTQKEKGDTLVLETHPIEGRSLMFYAQLLHSQDKKHEEYIQALIENKKIVLI